MSLHWRSIRGFGIGMSRNGKERNFGIRESERVKGREGVGEDGVV